MATQAAPVAAPPAAIWEDFIDIFYAPSAVFRRRESGNFFIPLAVITIVCGALFYLNSGALQPMFDAEFDRQMAMVARQNPNFNPEAADRMRGFAMRMQQVAMFIFIPIAIFGVGQERQDPIYTRELNGFSFRQVRTDGAPSGDVYKFTTYPRGSNFSAMSYTIGTAYISAKSQNPDACYRLIKAIASAPDLFSSMPARRSLINAGQATASDLSSLYNSIDAILKDPNTIAFPSGFAGGGAGRQVLEFWLYEAFDKYVLQNADLETALKEAETFAKAFQECLANTPPPDRAGQEEADFFRDQQCASKIDSRLKPPGQ